MIKFINHTVKGLFSFLFGLIILGLSYKLVYTLIRNELISIIAAFAIIVLLMLLFVFFVGKAEKLCKIINGSLGKLSPLKAGILLGCVCFFTKFALIFIFKCDCNLHPDMKMYISFASQIAEHGTITENTSYAATFSYTLFYGWLLSPFGHIFGNNSLGYEVVMTIITTVVMVLLFDILRKYAGQTTVLVGLLIYNLLPMGLMQTQVVIHETALLFFHILSLWLILKVFDSNFSFIVKAVLSLFAAVSACFGAAVNAAGKVVLIALTIFTIVKIVSRKKAKNTIIKSVILILCVCTLFTVAFCGCEILPEVCVERYIDKSYIEDSTTDASLRLPYGWGLYLGFNYDTHGEWNESDYYIYDKYLEFSTQEEAFEYQRNLIESRIDEYFDQIWKIPVHFFNKIVVLWSPYFTYSAVPSNPGYQTLILGYGGIFQKAIFLITYIGYIMFYLMSFVGLYNKKHNATKLNSPMLEFMLVALGVTSALLLFEVNTKYSSHMHILLFSIGIINFSSFRENMTSLRRKLLRITHCKSKKNRKLAGDCGT